jgi:hypothetical protein
VHWGKLHYSCSAACKQLGEEDKRAFADLVLAMNK